eukprot:6033032-Amphidinium_carterae.1
MHGCEHLIHLAEQGCSMVSTLPHELGDPYANAGDVAALWYLSVASESTRGPSSALELDPFIPIQQAGVVATLVALLHQSRASPAKSVGG